MIKMKTIHIFVLFISALLLGSQNIAYFFASSVPQVETSSMNTLRHLGFWVDERQMWSGSGLHWSPATFFNNYFLTAPYPSTMLFVTGPSQISGYMGTKAINWLPQVAALADSYPNIQINVLVFINMSDPAQVTELQNFVNALKGHSSIYGFEYEREYFGNTVAENTQFCNIVNSDGFTCIMDPSMASNFPNNPSLGYCEFPYFQSSDSVEACIYSGTGATEIGKGFGEYSVLQTFPAKCVLPANPTIPADPPCNGWNKQVIQAIVNDSLIVTLQNRIFTYVYAGYVTANSPLWNNSVLRGWIWSDPNYTLNYGLSIIDEKSTVTTASSTHSISASSEYSSTVTVNSSNNSIKMSSTSTTSNFSVKSPIGVETTFYYLAAIVIPASVACGYAAMMFKKRRKKSITSES